MARLDERLAKHEGVRFQEMLAGVSATRTQFFSTLQLLGLRGWLVTLIGSLATLILIGGQQLSSIPHFLPE
jgi:hypothetical protein